MVWQIWVAGVAQPQGSARAFKAGSRIVVTSANANLRPWRHAVTSEAQSHALPGGPILGPVELELLFILPWRKKHYNKSGLKSGLSVLHTTRPDLDKLARGVIDSLGDAGVLQNDSQIVNLIAGKAYGERPGCQIRLLTLDGAP